MSKTNNKLIIVRGWASSLSFWLTMLALSVFFLLLSPLGWWGYWLAMFILGLVFSAQYQNALSDLKLGNPVTWH